MKNKKAFVIFGYENIIKLLIAVLCLVALVYLGYKVYTLFEYGNKARQAEFQLNNIEKIANGLEDGKSVKYLLTSPIDWYLFNFPNENNKLWFCPIPDLFFDEEWVTGKFSESDRKKLCEKEKKGVPKDFDKEIRLDITYYNYKDNNIITEFGILLFELMDIYISKENGKIYIRNYDKKEYEQVINDISQINLNLDNPTLEKEAGLVLAKYEKEKNSKMALIIFSGGKKRIIPENTKVIKNKNFVIPGEKEGKKIYLIVEKY